jgi:fatty-acyl-CoA synthase
MELSTVGQLIRDLAREEGSRTALIFPELNFRCTFAELDAVSTRVAKNLYAGGFRKGDRFAIWANNLPEWIIVQFATAKLGVILLTVNTGLRRQELRYILGQSEALGLALVRGFRGIDFLQELEAIRNDLPALKHVFLLPDDFKSLTGDTDVELPDIPLAPDECINMQYTSGTTGLPKGVMLSHHNILRNAFDMGRAIQITASDSVCLQVPLFHCFGCAVAVLGAFTRAATIVGLTEFNPIRVLEAIHNHRCTVIFGVPTMFIALLNHPEFSKFDLTSLRTGIMGGAPCPREVMIAVIEKMGIKDLRCAYGLTEASPGVTGQVVDDTFEHRVATVGRAMPGTELKIVDPATGAELLPGREGELITRGYHVMLGYYKMPEETRRAIRDGWLYTGDLAVMDPDGYIRITGRSKDVIIRGGENIAPREVEEVLLTHPAIRDAYVYGVPDDLFGQQVAVAVQLKEGATLAADELRRFCGERVARFKVPEYVEFVTSFPTTPSGKVQKYKLAEAWVARNKR